MQRMCPKQYAILRMQIKPFEIVSYVIKGVKAYCLYLTVKVREKNQYRK